MKSLLFLALCVSTLSGFAQTSDAEAEAIIKYRDRRGNFRTWGDLLVIYGVDGTKIESLQDKMSF